MSLRQALISTSCYVRRLHCHQGLHTRTPLITFPNRRKPSGEPLYPLSLDKFISQTARAETPPLRPSPPHPNVQVASLPASYGRKPLTEQEIDAINMGYSE